MLAPLAALLCSAFPVRGSILLPPTSPLVIDQDSVRLVEGPRCACICSGSSKGVSVSTDTADKFRPLPGATAYNGFIAILATGSKWKGMDNSGMIAVCSTWVANPPESSRRFILHAKTADWAVWADSIDASSRIRWRWSRVQPNAPWVRWIDELQLGQSRNPSTGTPVLTTVKSVLLGDLLPESPADQGLTMQATLAKGTTIEWGYQSGIAGNASRTVLATPSDSVPEGTLFRVLDAYKADESDVRWSLPAQPAFIDDFLVSGSGTSHSRKDIGDPAASRMGRTAIEPSTGRTTRLDTPLSIGGHLLRDSKGSRFILVE